MVSNKEYKEFVKNFLKCHYINYIIDLNVYMYECRKKQILYKQLHHSIYEEYLIQKKQLIDTGFRALSSRIEIIGK